MSRAFSPCKRARTVRSVSFSRMSLCIIFWASWRSSGESPPFLSDSSMSVRNQPARHKKKTRSMPLRETWIAPSTCRS